LPGAPAKLRPRPGRLTVNSYPLSSAPGGILPLAFHIGDDTVHLDEWWGQKVCVDFFFSRSDEVADDLRAAGFDIEEMIEREPYPDVEHQSRRSYIFARRPKTDS